MGWGLRGVVLGVVGQVGELEEVASWSMSSYFRGCYYFQVQVLVAVSDIYLQNYGF